ncbi:hypothetical protein, partial [Enterobacter hormaechei]|uniref:hypothetical protein n=1 Tax=Enterobacter hormaechei TaxID=158836 RepID=UPI001C2D003A
VPAYGPQNDVTLKMPAFEWVHVQLHQQKGMISLSPPTICNSARSGIEVHVGVGRARGFKITCSPTAMSWLRERLSISSTSIINPG